ncbi:NAD-dependent epimerase/dehydratase family protein [Candidatus Pelagibacter sp. Uisw_106]|jgi:UDP-glucose 4-epimerase|uniref:NAD-dependent epimerase/dehydratase family protein n=1 Tax=Candidatus Pelagibacter sp. Uisw_106 TaxID=3230984 RepID=UPI0039EA919C
MKKCIVTGGAGFIGSHLVEKLVKKNYSVIVIDDFSTGQLKNLKNVIGRIKVIKKDISDNKNFDQYFKNVKYVFHLAAKADIVPSIEQPKKYFDTNVAGTLNVLEACRAHKVKKIIYAASSSSYGIAKEYPTTEKAKIDPEYPYAMTKYMGEELIIHWSKVYKLNYISLRLFNVYGLRARTTGAYGAMFGVFLAQKLNNKPLTVVGNGKQSRDFTYVTDIAEAFYMAAISIRKNEVINIGTGKPTSVIDIVKKLKSKFEFIKKRPGEPDKTHSSTSKSKKLLNWTYRIGISEGIMIMLKNINLWKNAPIWTKSKINESTKTWFKYLK